MNPESSLHFSVQAIAANAFAALIWWVVPIGAVLGAVIYVVWVSKFADNYANETNRSVDKFQNFQESFRAVHISQEQKTDPTIETD
jgi:hypothetical protein